MIKSLFVMMALVAGLSFADTAKAQTAGQTYSTTVCGASYCAVYTYTWTLTSVGYHWVLTNTQYIPKGPYKKEQ